MIVPTLARMIIREHLYKPIRGKVLTLGRQTISMTYLQLLQLLVQEGMPVTEDKLKSIRVSNDQKTRVGGGSSFVSDDVFFSLLGVETVNIMDVTDYEGADIIHDLNKQVPEYLEGQFDFIIDGGTFDHICDIRIAFENVVKMLKKEGRIFQWNAASNFTGSAYLSFGPDFFYDYYVVNQFSDCRVYLAEVDEISQDEFWDIYRFDGLNQYGHFQSDRILMVLVLAEKGPSSTFHALPIQAQYRDESLWNAYNKSKDSISSSRRLPFIGSKNGIKLLPTKHNPFPITPPKQIKGYTYLGKI